MTEWGIGPLSHWAIGSLSHLKRREIGDLKFEMRGGMFTGIVEATGTVAELKLSAPLQEEAARGGRSGRVGRAAALTGTVVREEDAGAPAPALQGRLKVRAPGLAGRLAVAGSIAVNGCCLTIVATDEETFSADLSGETLHKTAFAEMKAGAKVNLERPLTAGKEFGGHFVQGHVDGVGRVTRLEPEGENWWLSVRVPEEMWRYVAMKGSIAIDGISLTVAGWREGVVDTAIIPFTYANTNLRGLAAGAAVNIECDMLAKYLERLIEARGGVASRRLTVEELKAQGF